MFQPGLDAQVDFGESYADIGGQRVKFHGFEMRLNYSRKKFIQYFPSTDKEAFLEGHVRAFAYFKGVVGRFSYDNLSAGVAQVGKGKDRTLTQEFKELKGYYNFKTNFCQPGIEGAHEKTHLSIALGMQACSEGKRVRFFTAAELTHQLIEARDEKQLLRYQQQLARCELLIVDELGRIDGTKDGANLLFQVLGSRYERNSTIITSNLELATGRQSSLPKI